MRAHQRGQSLISTIAITTVVGLLVVASLLWAQTSSSQSARGARTDIALQAAEAGVQQYASRIVESRRYWNLFVDPAEDPRVSRTTGAVVDPGSPWTPGEQWDYAATTSNWKSLADARFGNASYSLRVYPLVGSTSGLRVQSTARVLPASGKNPIYKSVVATISPWNLADFQMVSDTSITYGSVAVTNGMIYSNQSINHLGTAKDKMYARRWVCRNPSGCSGSNASYFGNLAVDMTTTPAFAKVFKTPIDFSQFAYDRSLFKQAAQTPGLGQYFNDPTARGWMIQFDGMGRVAVFKITSATTPDLAMAIPALACPIYYNMRGGNLDNHLYFEQPVVIGTGVAMANPCDPTARTYDSVVDGRVTIASSGSVYIGGNIKYADPANDVLGIMAADSVIMAKYAPYDLSWVGATLAETGMWRTATTDESKHNLKFRGSTATKQGGYANMFGGFGGTRDYQWDPNLAVTGAPPMFPEIDGSWEVKDWREATPPT